MQSNSSALTAAAVLWFTNNMWDKADNSPAADGSSRSPSNRSANRPDRSARIPVDKMLLPVGRSLWAIAAGYMGLFAVLMIPAAPFAFILGVVAIRDIRKIPMTRHGQGRLRTCDGIPLYIPFDLPNLRLRHGKINGVGMVAGHHDSFCYRGDGRHKRRRLKPKSHLAASPPR